MLGKKKKKKKKTKAGVLTSSHDEMRFDEESDGFVGWLMAR